ncbi:2'-5' RNA ligase family protein [Spirillospora sp. NPDC046719]
MGCGRFLDVVHLVPSPHQPFRALTEAIAGQWPESEPYGGQFTEVIPYLTVAHQQVAQLLDQAEADLTGRLPLSAQVHEIHLLVSDGDRWHQEKSFELFRHSR